MVLLINEVRDELKRQGARVSSAIWQEALDLDASVGVKWFSSRDESALEPALAIRGDHLNRRMSY